MPGIHVRSLGKLDWVEHGNEPVLTVPGAYWLCHKKQIYKFTFKWHKTLRNTQGFAYPKELTKVIRRIIKSQPRQGQQFGTRHLLVTYNHSAWMRQDKMFAMLKFQDRSDATAFPHAFVLTVKTLDGASPNEADRPHPDEGPTLTVLEDAKNARLQQAQTSKDEENSGDPHDDQSTDRNPSARTKDQIEIFARVKHSEKNAGVASSSSKEAENSRKNDSGKKPTKRPRTSEKIEAASPLSKKKYHQDRINSGNKETPKDSLVEKETGADSADLPYQYIIEKEIENSKSASEAMSPGPTHKDHNSSIRSLPRSPKIAIADTARSANITDLVMEGLMFTIRQDQDSVTVVEQKTKLELDEVLENSEKAETKEGEKCLVNSSLLRLENLITKIEMPEARLKNNEEKPKSPSSGGDKIVDKPFPYNSASTNLEISAPATKPDAKISGNDSLWKYKEPSLPLQPYFSPESPKFPLVKINLDNVKNILSDTLSFDEGPKEANGTSENEDIQRNFDKKEGTEATDVFDEAEEEEDEVGLELKYEDKDEEDPEAENEDLHDDMEPESFEKNENEELLMDDFEPKKSPKNDPSSTPIKDCIETMKSKTPRVVSNEIVTDDQIPPELQRALHYKRTRRLFTNETTVKNVAKNEEEIVEEKITPEVESPASIPVKEVENEAPEEKTLEIPTIDITEEFERELSSGKARRQPTRRKSLRHVEQSTSEANRSTEEPEIHIEMWKFIQDITRGAKVVVHRLDLANIPNCIVTDSSLEKYNSSRRHATES